MTLLLIGEQSVEIQDTNNLLKWWLSN